MTLPTSSWLKIGVAVLAWVACILGVAYDFPERIMSSDRSALTNAFVIVIRCIEYVGMFTLPPIAARIAHVASRAQRETQS